ncbi:hypothetical protein M3Y99_00208900 [Aphelenchoides fujianensis]|nr:hypothetical protein M3Y99_00208900 [Aphelenchoides fujianensis]
MPRTTGLDTMYQPELGSLRQSRSYSALAPTNGMKYSLRHVPSDMRPFSAYKREKSEYDLVVAKHAANTRRLPANITTDSSLPPLPPTYRKQYPVPDKPRYENLQLYFGGRARGLEYSQPGLFDLERDDYSPMEDRRYHRLCSGARSSCPTCSRPLGTPGRRCCPATERELSLVFWSQSFLSYAIISISFVLAGI